MSSEHVRLEVLSDSNRVVISQIEVKPDQQGFINDGRPISNFITNAPLHPTFSVYGIYASDRLVGLIRYGHEEHDPERWWIPLIAIDHRQQGRGFGRAALLAAVDRMRHERPEKGSVEAWLRLRA